MNALQTAKRHTGILGALACTLALVLACAALTFAPANAFARDVGPARGATFTVGGIQYKVTDRAEADGDFGEVKLVKYNSTKKNPSINAVSYKGYRYEVEAIGKNAFNNARGHKITSITLGHNVDRIEARAFYGCSKLKTINIAKSDVIDLEYSYYNNKYYLDEVSIGSQAFTKAGVKNVTVKCGSNNASYKKVIKSVLVKKGLRSTAKVTR